MKGISTVSYKEIVKQITFELNEIESLIQLYKGELFELNREPTLVELTALASVLHSFYSGMEKIFLIIAKKIDKNSPHDINWHKTLLFRMAIENESREAVISESTRDKLSEYLAFRHFYRHSYSFHLDWEEMKELVVSIQQIWDTFRTEISNYLETLQII